MADEQEDLIERGTPTVDPTATKTVESWCAKIKAAKKFHDDDFKRMRRNMRVAKDGCDTDYWDPQLQYVVNIIQRHISQKTAALYAKNPKARAKRRQRIEYQIWDGKAESLAQAMQVLQAPAAGVPVDPGMIQQAQMLVSEVQNVQAQNLMMDRMGKTLEQLFHYFLEEQNPPFKKRLKQAVRRTIVTGVSYVKLSFQRAMEPTPDVQARIEDVSNRLAELERRAADLADGERDAEDPEIFELQAAMEALQAQDMLVVREGLVFDFPRATAVIVDPQCRQLDGFVGAGWIAEEWTMHPDEVQAVYEKDIKAGYESYTPQSREAKAASINADSSAREDRQLATVWRVWDKKTGLTFVVCDGYQDYLVAPEAPQPTLERFWPIFTLTFNDTEDEEGLYPRSDVDLLLPMQEEMNRTRQGLREHRRRNRPAWVAAKGSLDEEDKDSLKNDTVNALHELNVPPGAKISDIIQPRPIAPIDQNFYETNSISDDVLKVVGMQEANLGGLSGATATESSIAEQSRATAQGSAVDDLDDMLTELARASGQMLLLEMSKLEVMKVVGQGAVWPDVTGEQVAEEIYLEVKAGSSGRPNRAAEIANWERMAPILSQTPGINSMWVARETVRRLDESVEFEEALADGVPSIVAQNSMYGRQSSQGAGEGPDSDPDAQGTEGATNAQNPDQDEPGPQPAYPS